MMIVDYSVALDSFMRRAQDGDAQAEFSLGVMHGLGLGTRQDYVEAVRWYRTAAERGHLQAQSNLGFMYGTGRGVPQDFVSAYAWYSVAAARGEDVARRNRDAIAMRMSASQVEQGQRLSAEIFERVPGG